MAAQSNNEAVIEKEVEEPTASSLADGDVESFYREMGMMRIDLLLYILDFVAGGYDNCCFGMFGSLRQAL